jgi:hypothetical protein
VKSSLDTKPELFNGFPFARGGVLFEMHCFAGESGFKAQKPLRRNTHDSEKIGYKCRNGRGSGAGIAAKYFEIIEERSSEGRKTGSRPGSGDKKMDG